MICRCLWLFFLFAFGFADLFTFTEASTAMDVLPADSVLLTETFACEASAIFTILFILRAASVSFFSFSVWTSTYTGLGRSYSRLWDKASEPQHTNTGRTSSIEEYSNSWYSSVPIQP